MMLSKLAKRNYRIVDEDEENDFESATRKRRGVVEENYKPVSVILWCQQNHSIVLQSCTRMLVNCSDR